MFTKCNLNLQIVQDTCFGHSDDSLCIMDLQWFIKMGFSDIPGFIRVSIENKKRVVLYYVQKSLELLKNVKLVLLLRGFVDFGNLVHGPFQIFCFGKPDIVRVFNFLKPDLKG